MDRRAAGRVMQRLEKAYPDIHTPLRHRNPFQLLIAVILSAQCTDAQVNRATPALFAKYATAEALGQAPLRDLERLVHSCGFYRRKALAIRACARALVDEFGGRVPGTMTELIRLRGVGRKTANVVLSQVFGEAAVAVDTHVLRLSNRLGWAATRDPAKAELQIKKSVPEKWWGNLSLLLIFHGRRCCAARKPGCPACPVLRSCPYEKKHGV